MLKGEDVIVFSSGDWDMGPSTPQHISICLAEQNKVLFVETFGSRMPSILEPEHVIRIWRRLSRWFGGTKKQNIKQSQLYIYSPIAFPIFSKPFLSINRFIFINILKYLIKRLKIKNPILYFYLPPPIDVVGILQEKAIVYHSMDEWLTFRGGKNKIFMDSEKKIIEKADVVFAANELLYETKKPYARRIHKVYHGVDYEHFAREFPQGTPLPEDIVNIPRPIIAVVGAFADWMDLELIRLIAERHRNWSIVAIGTVESNVDIGKLINISNIHLLGQKSYSDLPNYYRAIDVFIIPFLLTEHIRYCAPTRLYEHLSSGKPVITTDFPAAREIGEGLINIAEDREDFIKKIEAALKEKDVSLVEKRKALAKKNTWKSRVEEISGIIEEIIAKR